MLSIVLCALAAPAVADRVPHGGAATILTGTTMGTTYSVTFHDAERKVDGAALRSRIDALLDRIDAMMSTWRPDSELSRFNSSTGTGWFPVSAETATVVAAAKAIGARSDGAFDITVGALVNLWGFGPARGAAVPPSRRRIEAALLRVDYRQIAVRDLPPALRKSHPDVELDLSGIAKGFAVDEVSRSLDAVHIRSHLVEIGGELRARGSRPDGSPWRVAIERPSSGEPIFQSVVGLRDAAIATSGDYRNYVEKAGKRFSHTIDPRTGRPVTHGLASVSVIADSAMRADALATAIMVMGPEAGYAFAVREALAVQLIVRSAQGFRVQRSPAFEKFLSP